MKKKILVLCTGNSCRSQMAEGYLKHFIKDKAVIYSAGIEAHGVNPLAIETMAEDGIDISGQTSNKIQEYSGIDFDYIITVCDNAKERCPHFPGKGTFIHKNFDDPARTVGDIDARLEKFREVRLQIKKFCGDFASANLLPGST